MLEQCDCVVISGSLTVNKASKLERYPVLKMEDLFSKLAGGKLFMKLGMSQAYQQVELEERSRQYSKNCFWGSAHVGLLFRLKVVHTC